LDFQFAVLKTHNMIELKRIRIDRCTTGVYLRWWYNGWHYYCFTNQYEVQMRTTAVDIMVTQVFSAVSKIERPTKLKTDFVYQITISNIPPQQIEGFAGLLMAEQVQQYEGTTWYDVTITRGNNNIKDAGEPAYAISFEVTRKELPNTAATYQPTQLLYIGDTLADLDDDEVIAQNKQVNDIAEMQDRQSDFTATFRVRKSRTMRALFELSGEVGAGTNLPYEQLLGRLVQDGVEVIPRGEIVLNKVDEQYYYISIYSGNLNFFKAIEGLKLGDLTLASCNHTWSAPVQAATHASDLDYVYPLCEPSNDGGLTPLTDTGNRVELYGGWLLPFIKVKAIWDEILSNAGYTASGDLLTDPVFLGLAMPIVSLTVPKGYSDGYLYSGNRRGYMLIAATSIFGTGGTGALTVIAGDALFGTGHYVAKFTATHKIQVKTTHVTASPTLYLYINGANTSEFIKTWSDATHAIYELSYAATAGMDMAVWGTANTYYSIDIAVTEITDPQIAFNSPLEPHYFLPDMLQSEFIKMICNLFAQVPDAKPRTQTLRFWNYSKLYSNTAAARDWSAYLSELADEVEFKFGDYAQRNYLRYKDCDDVILDAGAGIMTINDTTLPLKKDVVQLPVSTCDEVLTLTDAPVCQLNFNNYDEKTDLYVRNENIDPRLVFISQCANTKTFGIRTSLVGGTSYDSVAPKKASSSEIAFSALMPYYGGLAKMLTKTNLRRAKFNLPAYEVAGFKYDTPIYLSQYKAYFYVNKINNYVVGKLCTIELIKL
jgi:hypothetical protein